MNSAVNSDEQCVNSDFCLLHSESMWGYCSRVGKKKKKKAKRETGKHNNYLNPNTHLVSCTQKGQKKKKKKKKNFGA